MGSARQFMSFARVAIGDLDGAVADFEAASRIATAKRARRWRGHATRELADVLGRTGRTDRARQVLDGIARCRSSPRLLRRCREESVAIGRREVAVGVIRS
jgi:hypothetical protein